MKKIQLFLYLLFLSVFALGQQLQTAKLVPVDEDPVRTFGDQKSYLKGGGDIIWQTSFDWQNLEDPRGWTLPEGWQIHDNSDLGNYWAWTKDSIHNGWRNLGIPSYFDIENDGFISLPIGYYNRRDGVETVSPADSYIQTEPIDCSSASSVVVRFSQEFRLCCSNYNLDLLVSADDGAHWASYDVRFDVAGNVYTPERFRDVEINVSDVAAGAPSVLIRFHMWGNSYYFWIIDDLALIEAFDHDLVLEDTWLDFDGGFNSTIDHINYWPLSQMGMPGESSGTIGNYFMKGAVLNKGMSDADNARLDLSILRNGTEVYSSSSETKSIWSLDRDTMHNEPFVADDYGDYRFDFNVVNDIEDEVENNNTASMFFTVNDTLSHRADFTAEAYTNTGGWVGGGNAGDMVSVFYNIYAPVEINSISAFIGGFTPDEHPQFQFVMFKSEDGDMVEWCGTDIFDMDSSYRLSWVTKPVLKDGETEFLEPGNYAACVRMWGFSDDDENGTQGMTIGRDLTTKFSGCQQYYAYGDLQWTNLAGAPLFMIGFNIKSSDGPGEAPVTFNVDMNLHMANGEFNPDSDYLDVAGTFNSWNGSAHLSDTDGDGIYSISIEGMPVGEDIEFKYRINGNWDTSEFPDGGPNRSYTIRYWNELDHIYNDGLTTGTESLISRFTSTVYPNPSTGRFVVNISNPSTTNVELSLHDSQGKLIYQKLIDNIIEHNESIDIQLAKGIYFLNIDNGRESEISKVIIR